MTEHTVVLIKPDGVKRGLVGEILSRFEKVGLKIVAAKMAWVDQDLVGKHYKDDEDYHRSVGVKTLENYQKYGLDASETLGTLDPVEVGRMVRKWNMGYLSSGPVVAIVLEAHDAVSLVRKMTGHTFPQNAQPGTIRGDLAHEAPLTANIKKRSTMNLIHASGSVEEAKFEEELWFRENEIHSYKRLEELLSEI
ncbi:MAG: Nucleoside diphosphate kinase [Candidatus Saccharibacteria bacterium GW2011_GWA2_46_10]|nr:MAG: Nucleoside diphosphate kinase [Candidatus Saccharibacteria bacterium GW2011_GWA2_46_10]